MAAAFDYLHDTFARFGPIRLRKMFGGWGIYKDDLMFALVADEALYLKTDAQSQPEFAALRLQPFVYQAVGRKPIAMSYWRAPDIIFDDADAACEWATKAHAAAVRSHKLKKPKAAARLSSLTK